MAGACRSYVSKGDFDRVCTTPLELTTGVVLDLRAFPELALGLAAAFFTPGFLAVVLLVAFVAGFLGAAFLGLVPVLGALGVAFCRGSEQVRRNKGLS